MDPDGIGSIGNFAETWGRPMTSTGCLSSDMMTMMMKILKRINWLKGPPARAPIPDVLNVSLQFMEVKNNTFFLIITNVKPAIISKGLDS